MKGKILAVDLKQMKKITDVNFLLGDFQVPAIQERVQSFFGGKIDAVISDMASDTTGNKSVDSIRTGELCLSAMRFAQLNLKENGVFLSKFFMGSNFSEIKIKANTFFRKVIIFKPSSSRSESRESYIFCKKTFK
jgi:23S rRNA U2552 (ribose-2'-O)-methylase RlmE/FtsJ